MTVLTFVSVVTQSNLELMIVLCRFRDNRFITQVATSMDDLKQDTCPKHWKDDRLGRWQQAQFLTYFMGQQYDRLHAMKDQAIADGLESKPCHFVMNIDSSWGLGKTFFLNRWKQDLENEDYLVLSFDAWANDFSKDPLLSFLSEIGSQLTHKLASAQDSENGKAAVINAERWARLKKSTSALLQTYGPSVAKKAILAAVTTSILGVPITSVSGGQGGADDPENVDENGDGRNSHITAKALQGALTAVADFESGDLFQEQNSRKQAVQDFKKSLGAIVQSVREHENSLGNKYRLPLFILIDELDRCRPDFTIELIEVVKHIFSVEDVFFVFATDGQQLQAALEGTYGARFDAETYFNRIFSREMHLRKPNNRQFAEALLVQYAIVGDESLMKSLITLSVSGGQPWEAVLHDVEWVADVFGLTLRDQDQLIASFHSLAKLREYRGHSTCTVIGLALLVFWQQKRQLFKDFMMRPNEFIKPSQWSNRLNDDFSSFLESKILSIRSSNTSNGSVTQTTTTLPNVLAEFADLARTRRVDVAKRLSGGGTKLYFSVQMSEEVFNCKDEDRSGMPLIVSSYFDDIMMAG